MLTARVLKIKPSRDLVWEKCYDNQFDCARLDVSCRNSTSSFDEFVLTKFHFQVPMDWLDPTEEQRVVLGVIKLAAKSKGKNFSPVFVNPGVSLSDVFNDERRTVMLTY